MWRNRLIHKFGLLSALVVALLCTSCEGTTFRSSVPAYPVRVVIDTRVGSFVHFIPTALGSHVVVNKDGYFMDNNWVAATSAMDAWGYGGVVVYISTMGYDAYDLACPACAEKGRCSPCTINSMFAECPECGEQYDLMSGTAAPQHGIAHETLRPLWIVNSDGRITVSQMQ